MTLPITDRLQTSVKALDELSNNKRLTVTTRLALLEASDNIGAANEMIEELVGALTEAIELYGDTGYPLDPVHHWQTLLDKIGGGARCTS